MLTGYNNKIATRPFSDTVNKVEIVNGVAVTQSRISLVPLEVVFGIAGINPGDTVYVAKEMSAHQWAKTVMNLEGEDVIVVPVDMVQFIKRGRGWNDPVGVTA
jgi:uncharacterized protein (UPF0210 family)